MFDYLRLRFRDAGTIKALSVGAEKHAVSRGEQHPGAEHYLLAALDLPDGTARRALARVGVDADSVSGAIAAQHDEALYHAGVDSERLRSLGNDEPIPVTSNLLFHAKPSGEAVMQQLSAVRSRHDDAMLLGAHVLEVIATMQQGIAARALRLLGVDSTKLKSAARAEAASFKA